MASCVRYSYTCKIMIILLIKDESCTLVFQFLSVFFHLSLVFRLQTESYQCFREKMGVAKTVEKLELVSNEIKAALMVRYMYMYMHLGQCAKHSSKIIQYIILKKSAFECRSTSNIKLVVILNSNFCSI